MTATPLQCFELNEPAPREARGQLALSSDYTFLTFQGEGPFTGHRTLFVRLAGCNYTCSWCDTAYTWDWTGINGHAYDPKKEVTVKSIFEVAEHIASYDPYSITFTGGEPLLQNVALDKLINLLDGVTHLQEVHFETNGSIFPYWTNRVEKVYVVSPKLRNSGTNHILNRPPNGNTLTSLRRFATKAGGPVYWKFVCGSVEDLDEVEATLNEIQYLGSASPDYPTPILIPASSVWVMPEGVTEGVIVNCARILAPEVLRRGWNLSLRNHISIWGNKRGR